MERTKIVLKKYFKYLAGTDGIWEIRVSSGGNIFRGILFLRPR
ncbi:type II toxin-antitoxin system RelE/ParE family toxin [Aequorivita ciconiae]|nr:type II toxin-antitoxin system RelE/ParE family toxin [Aequorivita sp. H23M31]